MISTPGNASTSSGKVGPHMLIRAVVASHQLARVSPGLRGARPKKTHISSTLRETDTVVPVNFAEGASMAA